MALGADEVGHAGARRRAGREPMTTWEKRVPKTRSMFVGGELLDHLGAALGVGAVVLEDDLDRAAVDAAGVVEDLERGGGGALVPAAVGGADAGAVELEAEADRLGGLRLDEAGERRRGRRLAARPLSTLRRLVVVMVVGPPAGIARRARECVAAPRMSTGMFGRAAGRAEPGRSPAVERSCGSRGLWRSSCFSRPARRWRPRRGAGRMGRAARCWCSTSRARSGRRRWSTCAGAWRRPPSRMRRRSWCGWTPPAAC